MNNSDTPQDLTPEQEQAMDEQYHKELSDGQLREMFRKANLHALDLAERIKRLEAAGEWMAYARNDDDFNAAVKAWAKAKEAKP